MKRLSTLRFFLLLLLSVIAWVANAKTTHEWNYGKSDGPTTIYVDAQRSFSHPFPSYITSCRWFLRQGTGNSADEEQETGGAKIVSSSSSSCVIQGLWDNSDSYGNWKLELYCVHEGYSEDYVAIWQIVVKSNSSLRVEASPAGGTVDAGTKVTLTAKSNGNTVSGCDIYYTLDGTTPTKSSTKYTSSGVTIEKSCWLNAKAFKTGYESIHVDEWYYYVSPVIAEVNETNFPDENFRTWILAQDYGNDGKLTEDEIKSVWYIDISGSADKRGEIKSLSGIEYFTELKNLYCYWNQLTTLDVSKNTSLTNLYCQANQLTTLDVSKNTALEWLRCEQNQLTSLDVSKNTVLKKLDCGYNQLSSIDVSKNTALTGLDCRYNQLISLDVSKNLVLETLWCYSNRIVTLDVSNTALKTLYCYENQIKETEMDKLIAGLPMNTTSEATTFRLICTSSYSEGNVCTKEQVATAKARGWTPLNRNFSDWIEYEGSEDPNAIEINEANFPDENFRNWILAQNYGRDARLSDEEIKSVTSIAVAGESDNRGIIKSLKGIEYFTALTTLNCRFNQLTSLDVSKNTALTDLRCNSNQLTSLDVSKNTALTELSCGDNPLTSLDVSKNTALTDLYCNGNKLTSIDVSKNATLTYLDCGGNQLTSLDVSKNTALTTLSCGDNQLTSLDVSKNTALRYLYCHSNQLTSLDVSKNTALTTLSCHSNQLTSLDVSKNTALTTLSCYRNQINGASMDALIQSLPTTSTNPTFRLIDNREGDEGNECTKSQVAAAKEKGWTPLYYNGSKWMEYEGSEDFAEKSDVYLVSVTCDNQNLDRLTNSDKLIFHATFGNDGATDTIPSAIMLLNEDATRILASGDYEWAIVKKGEQVTVDYEYALDTIPQGQYKATVLYYDWNEEGWYYSNSFVHTITIISNYVKGDVNMDNAVNGTDLVALSNIVLGRKEKTESADVNGDGSVNGTDIVALSNIILGRSSNAPRRTGEAGTGLSIEPFDIKAGEEKEMLIDLSNPNDEITLVQFDLHLPEGLSIKKNGTDLDIDMGDRTSWRKHTLDANETDGVYRFLLYSSSNTVIEGTSGAVIKVKVVADASFKGGKIVIDNTLLVSPDEKETKPETFEYTFPTADDGSAKLAIEPFDIKAGEEKEIMIDLSNPNDEVTLVQFDLQLPEGLTVKKSGADLVYDMADRTSWRKHTLDANETDGGYRFLLYSSSNTVIDGTSGAVFKVTLVANQDMSGKKITLDNILLVSPDEKETKPARYEYVIGTETGIRNITLDSQADTPIYNLRGQRLTAPQKGINIIGGKKMVVK